jgi:hypothetical protein
MSSLATPRDETETEEDPFADADAGSGSESDGRKNDEKGEKFKVNVHALSSDDDVVTGEETENEEAESNMDTDHANGDDEIPPRMTSTPVSESAEIFKIVDIESRANAIFPILGDANSAHSATHSGDAVSAKASDENSASAMSGPASDAGSANHVGNPLGSGSGNTAQPQPAADSGSSNPKTNSKVPAMVKPPKFAAPPRIPAEADASPSNTYKSILAAKKNKACPPTIPGTGCHNVNYECGSFYNKGDNRALRSVYKENVATLCVSSLSFNPITWLCNACPKKHPIAGGGRGETEETGGGEGGVGQLWSLPTTTSRLSFPLLPGIAWQL